MPRRHLASERCRQIIAGRNRGDNFRASSGTVATRHLQGRRRARGISYAPSPLKPVSTRHIRRAQGSISYAFPIPRLPSPTPRCHKTAKKWRGPLARSLELCKCSRDRTVRLSNFRERPVSPDAFHTPIRLARLSRAETEEWGPYRARMSGHLDAEPLPTKEIAHSDSSRTLCTTGA